MKPSATALQKRDQHKYRREVVRACGCTHIAESSDASRVEQIAKTAAGTKCNGCEEVDGE